MSRPNSTPRGDETAARILDVAERLVQTRGFNAFSYADIATKLSVTKASLHYHFPTKEALGEKLIERYHVRFLRALADIGRKQKGRPLAQLEGYAALYLDVLQRDRMCLCGMLASDHATLPTEMQKAVRQFFDANEVWLIDVLENGRASGALAFDGAADEMARLFVATLEGAMMVARTYRDPSRFEAAARRLLADVTPPAAPSGSSGTASI